MLKCSVVELCIMSRYPFGLSVILLPGNYCKHDATKVTRTSAKTDARSPYEQANALSGLANIRQVLALFWSAASWGFINFS